ncbi:MAG: DUF305 domain-containing protein [bacterium]|nr:DUF305 domain-containing protein [bacterium]
MTRIPVAALAVSFLLLSGISHAHDVKSADMDMKPTEMKECMAMTYTGDVDRDFIKNMIPHHEMAIDMARKEIKKGKDGHVLKMAEKIIEDQTKEIEVMKAWLKESK